MNNRNLLISGGTGSFGNAVLRKYLNRDDFQEISDTQEYEKFVVNDLWATDSPDSDSNSDIDVDREKKLREFGLTKKQIPVFMLRMIEQRPISSIANELKISKRAVYKHLSNIKQNVNAKITSQK